MVRPIVVGHEQVRSAIPIEVLDNRRDVVEGKRRFEPVNIDDVDERLHTAGHRMRSIGISKYTHGAGIRIPRDDLSATIQVDVGNGRRNGCAKPPPRLHSIGHRVLRLEDSRPLIVGEQELQTTIRVKVTPGGIVKLPWP